MDGSGIDFIIIPVVVTISLAAWLILVAYADGHPRWGSSRSAHRPASAGQTAPADRRVPDVPVQDPAGTAVAGPVQNAGARVTARARADDAVPAGRQARQDSARGIAA